MKIDIQNIGNIENVSIELNGITVIEGENNTGKSTIGKALFAVVNSLYAVKDNFFRERVCVVNDLLSSCIIFMHDNQRFVNPTYKVARQIVSNVNFFIQQNDFELQRLIYNLYSQYECSICFNQFFLGTFQSIRFVLNMSSHDFLKDMLACKLNSEFCCQICNIFSFENVGRISIGSTENSVDITVSDNNVWDIKSLQWPSFNSEVIYIDAPLVFDELNNLPLDKEFDKNINHRQHLHYKLVRSNTFDILNYIAIKNQLTKVFHIIDSICVGDLVLSSEYEPVKYALPNTNRSLPVGNLSSGLKTFVVLKILLKNLWLSDYCILIVDEPESNLHPEYQLVLAEILVLLYKELNVKILLNTQSPYLLIAIEVYANKYEIKNNCKFYLSKFSRGKASISDVSSNLEPIYNELFKPFKFLGNNKWRVTKSC